jgi:glycosyltransferase involved in cell wall biosynthesis
MRTRFLVVNTSMPELDLVAAELDRRGALECYLRRYAALSAAGTGSTPVLSRWLQRSIGRRAIGVEIDHARIKSAGVLLDFSAACVNRLSRRHTVGSLGSRLIRLRDRRIAAAGARLPARGATTGVVANYSSALPAFQAMRDKGGRTLLNYPSADYRYCRRIVEEERELQPVFADTLQFNYRPSMADRLDAERSLADKILTGSSFAKRTLVEAGSSPDRVAVIPFGVDTELFRPPADRVPQFEQYRVLFVGRIGQAKGISYLLQAYRNLSGPGTRLTLVGNFVGPPKVFAPYRSGIHHIAHVPRPLLPGIYADADVLVFPTLFEGMGMVVLEAMACGLPVIVTPRGPDQVVRDGKDGFIVPIRDTDALTQRMEQLRSDPDLRLSMGLEARHRALRFTCDHYARQAADRILDAADPATTRA